MSKIELKKDIPLCVDLDGTLIKTDTLQEGLVLLLKHQPFLIFSVLWWLLRHGRAYLKQEVAKRVTLNPAQLPYNEALLSYLNTEKLAGRRLILVTATDHRFADAIARHVGIFEEVIASDGKRNIRAAEKAKVLCERFGEGGFDYAGNHADDKKVWAKAHAAVVVNAPAGLAKIAKEKFVCIKEIPRETSLSASLWCLWRPYQMSKNILVFLPAILGHQWGSTEILGQALLGFFAFSLVAMSAYGFNDVLDIESDRAHPYKKLRPLAKGNLLISAALFNSVIFLSLGLIISSFLNPLFFSLLLLYAVFNLAYSLWIKSILLWDVILLALLYTVRILAGMTLIKNGYSDWLLMVSFFFFLSLAFLKRYIELKPLDGLKTVSGRAYQALDRDNVRLFGVVSGYLSSLVFTLYLHSERVMLWYKQPLWLWGVCLLMIYWISYVWLLAERGLLKHDPVLFALTDKMTYFLGALVLVLGYLAVG